MRYKGELIKLEFHGDEWTPPEDDKLEELYAARKSNQDISDILLRSKSAISGRIIKLQLSEKYPKVYNYRIKLRSRTAANRKR